MWIFFILFGGYVQNIIENLMKFFEHTVITTIESINQDPMILPAIIFVKHLYKILQLMKVLLDVVYLDWKIHVTI